MSIRSRIKGALSRAKARSKAAISKRKTQAAKVRAKVSASKRKTQVRRAQQKTRAAAQRKEVVATAKAVATPRQQRTPEQLERTRAVARFGLGAVTAAATGGAVGAAARAVGKRVAAKAAARGISTKTIQRAGRLGTGGLITAGVVSTGVQAKRIKEGRAGAFETGFTFGGAGILARPTARAISSVRQIVRPKVVIPKVKSVVRSVGVQQGAFTRAVAGIKTQVGVGRPRERYVAAVAARKDIITAGLTREIGRKKAGEITAFATRELAPGVRIGAARGIKEARRPTIGAEADLVTIERGRVTETAGVFAGERGRGIFRGITVKGEAPKDIGGRVTTTRTKLETREKVRQQLIEAAKQEQERAAKAFEVRETKRIRGRARTRLRSGIRQITPQVTAQIAGQATRVTAKTVVDVGVRQRQREDTVLKDITTEIPAPKVPVRVPTRTPTQTRTPTPTRTPTATPRVPFIPLLPFGGAGSVKTLKQPKIGKELGGRFTRSFSAEVLGLKAPRKRKVKRRYTGFELRI